MVKGPLADFVDRDVALWLKRNSAIAEGFLKCEEVRNSASASAAHGLSTSPPYNFTSFVVRDRLLGMPEDTRRGERVRHFSLPLHDPPSIIPQLLRKPRLWRGFARGRHEYHCRRNFRARPTNKDALSLSLSLSPPSRHRARWHGALSTRCKTAPSSK